MAKNQVYFELRTQDFEMFAEGTCDARPKKEIVVKKILERGYYCKSFECHYDDFQGIWRFCADIERAML